MLKIACIDVRLLQVVYIRRQSAGKGLKMDNEILLAKNARCGDGTFWRHPECVNSKLVSAGTDLGVSGFDNKLRSTIKDQTSEIIPKGSRLPGFKAVEAEESAQAGKI